MCAEAARVDIDTAKYMIETRLWDHTSKSRWKNARKISLELASKLGIPVIDEPVVDCGWTGKALHVWKKKPADLFHDIAHFQCCSNARRKVAEFGLGAGYETIHWIETNKKRMLEPKYCSTEESHASALGILWQMHFGLPTVPTLIDHSWTYHDGLAETIKGLIKVGLIDNNGTPSTSLLSVGIAELEFSEAL